MKKLTLSLLAGAALGLAGAAQAADAPVIAKAPSAPPGVSGYIGLYIGGSWWKSREYDDKGEPFVFGGEARLNHWLSRSSSIQLDLEAEATNRIDSDAGADGRLYGKIGIHYAVARDPSSHAWGIFGDLIGANNTYFTGVNTYWLVGVEAQRYMGNVTWYGQAGYLSELSTAGCSSGCGEPDHAWFVRGVVRLFTDADTKLQAELGYAKTDPNTTGSDSSARIWNWGVSAERRFSGPWSGFVEYAGYKYEGNTVSALSEHVFLAGVKLYVNSPSLIWVDRNGATFDNPKFIRALSSSCGATTC